jgi:hypothetical protein
MIFKKDLLMMINILYCIYKRRNILVFFIIIDKCCLNVKTTLSCFNVGCHIKFPLWKSHITMKQQNFSVSIKKIMICIFLLKSAIQLNLALLAFSFSIWASFTCQNFSNFCLTFNNQGMDIYSKGLLYMLLLSKTNS